MFTMFDLSKSSKEIARIDSYIKQSKDILKQNNDYLIQGQIQKIKNEFGFECSLDSIYIMLSMAVNKLAYQNKWILIALINRLENERTKIMDKYHLAKQQIWVNIVCAFISFVGAVISVGINIVFR